MAFKKAGDCQKKCEKGSRLKMKCRPFMFTSTRGMRKKHGTRKAENQKPQVTSPRSKKYTISQTQKKMRERKMEGKFEINMEWGILCEAPFGETGRAPF